MPASQRTKPAGNERHMEDAIDAGWPKKGCKVDRCEDFHVLAGHATDTNGTHHLKTAWSLLSRTRLTQSSVWSKLGRRCPVNTGILRDKRTDTDNSVAAILHDSCPLALATQPPLGIRCLAALCAEGVSKVKTRLFRQPHWLFSSSENKYP